MENLIAKNNLNKFITGNKFKKLCHYSLDEAGFAENGAVYNNFYFVKTDLIDLFFKSYLPHEPFILVTHNSDHQVGPQHLKYLDLANLVQWYAQNVNFSHPKLISIPIGLCNFSDHEIFATTIIGNKQNIVYANYSLNTNRSARLECLNQTKIPLAPAVPLDIFNQKMAESYFVLAPDGNGVDTHRLWEALYLRAVPIVTKSINTLFYKDLPLIILDSWADFDKLELSPELYQQIWKDFDPTSLTAEFFFHPVVEAKVLNIILDVKSEINMRSCQETWLHDNSSNLLIHTLNNLKDVYTALRLANQQHHNNYYLLVSTDNYVNIAKVLELIKTRPATLISGHGGNRVIDGMNITMPMAAAGLLLSQEMLNIIIEFTWLGLERLWQKVSSRNNLDENSWDIALAYILKLYSVDTTNHKNFSHCTYKGFLNQDSRLCCDKMDDPSQIIVCGSMEYSMLYDYHEYLYAPMPHYPDNYTLVTCFYHLAKYGTDFNKPVDFYLNKGKFVLSVPVNLVIYCDIEQYEFIAAERDRHGLLHKTKIVVKPLNEWPLFNYRDKITANRKGNPTYFDNRNTPTYFAVVGSKFDMIIAATTANYFNNDYYGWIDLGLKYAVGPFHHQLARVLNCQVAKARFCYMKYWPDSITNNLAEYYQGAGKMVVCAGFFTGQKQYLTAVCTEGRKILFDTINKGYGHAEEQVLGIIAKRFPQLFDLTYGYYYQLFSNYDKIRSNATFIWENTIKPARAHNQHQLCYDACQRLVAAWQDESINLVIPMETMINLIDDYYIAAFYLRKMPECVTILKLHFQCVNKYGSHYEKLFKDRINHIIANSDYLWPFLKNGREIRFGHCSDYDKDKIIIIIYDECESGLDSLVINNPIRRHIRHKLN